MASYFFYIATASVAISASSAVTAPAHTASASGTVTHSASSAVTAAAHTSATAAVANRSASATVTAAAHVLAAAGENGIGSTAAVTAPAGVVAAEATARRIVFDADLDGPFPTVAIVATSSDAPSNPIGYEFTLKPNVWLFEVRGA